MIYLPLPINLFERSKITGSFTRSVSLTWGYYLHILPYFLLKMISVFLIIMISYFTALYLTDIFHIPAEQLFIGFTVGLYLITIPFCIVLRVCYYTDLVLRNEGFESLKNIREIYCRYFDIAEEPYFGESYYPKSTDAM